MSARPIRFVSRKVPTADLRPGQHIAVPGWGDFPIPVLAVGHRSDGITLLVYEVEHCGRIQRKQIARKTSGKSTVYERVEVTA